MSLNTKDGLAAFRSVLEKADVAGSERGDDARSLTADEVVVFGAGGLCIEVKTVLVEDRATFG